MPDSTCHQCGAPLAQSISVVPTDTVTGVVFEYGYHPCPCERPRAVLRELVAAFVTCGTFDFWEEMRVANFHSEQRFVKAFEGAEALLQEGQDSTSESTDRAAG